MYKKEDFDDWRALPALKDKYISNVFNYQWEDGERLHDFPMSEASDWYICFIEKMWHLKIDEDVAVELIMHNAPRDLSVLILISEALGN